MNPSAENTGATVGHWWKTRSRFLTIFAVFVCTLGSQDLIQGYIVGNEYKPMYMRASREFFVPKPKDKTIHASLVDSESIAVATDGAGDHFHPLVVNSHDSVLTENTNIPATVVLSPLENWCLLKLDRWYTASQSMRCPFFRRRLGDTLDIVEALLKHTIIRKECWEAMGPPQAHRPVGVHPQGDKLRRLSPEELVNILRNDWKVDSNKGYYVTGRLTTAIYRDDCLFLGPDPDLPCTGLRKYMGVASHLFDYRSSFATLKSLEITPGNPRGNMVSKEVGSKGSLSQTSLVAHWKLKGVLRLPWKPSLPLLSGRTIYHVDDDGLIGCHEEHWDSSIPKAFCYTFFPRLARRIWPDTETSDGLDESSLHPTFDTP